MPEAPKPPAAPLEDVPREDEVRDDPPLTPPVTICTALLLEPPTEDDEGQTQTEGLSLLLRVKMFYSLSSFTFMHWADVLVNNTLFRDETDTKINIK